MGLKEQIVAETEVERWLLGWDRGGCWQIVVAGRPVAETEVERWLLGWDRGGCWQIVAETEVGDRGRDRGGLE